MFTRLIAVFLIIAGLAGTAAPAYAQNGPVSETYSSDELVDTGHRFFGQVAQGLASLVERAVANYGLPNGYILGQEGSGAFFGGVRYGDGTLYTKNAGQHSIFWQGPTLGFDVGADGSRVMMLVYNLSNVSDVYTRYPGVDGSAYAIGGLGMTVMRRNGVYVVPIRSGIGARLGVNVGYLKFTQQATWNPF
ncbi:DUF1134 domain-containing protein [Cucumibacter marinus]|uniref:DUF1134 domain-containing protein n=1 Tax=Cucumibacter marinus TaxID=1121252 RepID=UPI0004092E57|nr:DUF1134 domain-containing protein [Cucumibacter marinus]